MIDRLLEPDVEHYIKCDKCECEIYDGYMYWEIEGYTLCEGCKDEYVNDFLSECERTYEYAQGR